MIASTPSIGVNLDTARQLNQASSLLAWMIVILIIGILVDIVFGRANTAIRRRLGVLDKRRLTTRPATVGRPRPPVVRQDGDVDISAKSDYAVRALLALATHGPDPVPGEVLATEQQLPRKFLEAILADLRRAGLVHSRRGAVGGYRLARTPDEITLGQVIRAVDGPLAEVRGRRPEETSYLGAAAHLPEVWVAVRAALRHVLDETTLAQVLSGKLPRHVRRLAAEPDAWAPR